MQCLLVNVLTLKHHLVAMIAKELTNDVNIMLIDAHLVCIVPYLLLVAWRPVLLDSIV